MPLALLFDLDGTMVDTDSLHIAAWNAVLASHQRAIDATYYKSHVMGFANEAVTEALFPDHAAISRTAFTNEKEAAFRAQVGRLEPTAGLSGLLDWADFLGLPKAVVTNAPRDNAELMLRGLGWLDRFPVLIIGDELVAGKPDPLPYLMAMRRLGVEAAGSIAFEDSLSGVRAAAASGAQTVGLTTALSEQALRDAGATIVARDFTDPALLAVLRRRAEGG